MKLSRRELLKQLSAGAALAALEPTFLLKSKLAKASEDLPQNTSALSKPRVAIIGGGIGGVSTAWMLDGAAEILLFEAAPHLGGHAHTVPIEYGGKTHPIDVGAQYFSPISYKYYTKMIECAGLDRYTIPATQTLSVFSHDKRYPYFVSPKEKERIWPIFAPWNLAGLSAFGTSINQAKKLMKKGDWDLNLKDFVAGLKIDAREKRDVIFPYLASASGGSITEGASLSALSVTFYATEALNQRIVPSPIYNNSSIGLQGNIKGLAQGCRTLQTYLRTPIMNIEREGTQYRLNSIDGNSVCVDHVIFACPPSVSANLLKMLPGSERQVEILEKFQSFYARILIHKDPVYMPANRRYWSSVNTEMSPNYCQSSMWYGGMRPKLEDGSTLDLFKSWATNRDRESKEILHDQHFKHILTTPEMVRAISELEHFQGHDRLWFTGAYMGGPVNQETATHSAVRVAEALVPHAKNIQPFMD